MKKGFTLIELLAVIVILAIIALIATPIVLDIVEDSKKRAVKESANSIVRAANIYAVQNEYIGKLSITDDSLEYKGERPEKGEIELDKEGNVRMYAYIDGYCVTKEYTGNIYVSKTNSEECSWYGTDNYEKVSGSIVTLDNQEIMDYRIYGNTYQETSEPSPENPSEIVSLGSEVTAENDPNYGKYKIDIKVTGRNLIEAVSNYQHTNYGVTIKSNINESTFTITGISNTEQGHLVALIGPKIVSGEYKIKIEGNENIQYFVQGLEDDGTWIKNYITGLIPNTNYKLTIDEDVNIRIGIVLSDAIDYNDEYKVTIQPALETVDIEYEPYKEEIYSIYLDEPLRCIGDICDYIDYENKQVVRRIKQMILSGSENWTNMGGNAPYLLNIDDRENSYKGDLKIISSHFKTVLNSESWVNYPSMLSVSSLYPNLITFRYEDKSTLEEFKNWLIEQQNNNNPVKIQYILKEEIEESIELPEIKSYEEISNIMVTDGNLYSSNIELYVK